MRSVLSLSFGVCIAVVLASCSHIPLRLPQSTSVTYNPEHIRLLREAANNGVLIQISDSTLRDVPQMSAGDRCRKAIDGQWIEQLYGALESLSMEKQLNKIQIIEFRRGDQPGYEISKDLDGAVSLEILYSKSETRKKIETFEEIPCADRDMEFLGKEMIVTHFDWPTPNKAADVLRSLPERPKVDRLEFDHRFALWLADRLTVVRMSPELGFEKTTSGKSLLTDSMEKLSNEVTANSAQETVNDWLKEISAKSKQGSEIKFFAFKRDQNPSSGLLVDSDGKFSRKIPGYNEPTYLFVSYRLENNEFSVGTLSQLSNCLQDFMQTYRSPVSSMNSYDMTPESFLAPGHSCGTGQDDQE